MVSFNLTSVICLHIVKWLNNSIWSIDGILTDTTTPDQSGAGSNDNEGILHIPQSSMTGAIPSSDLVSYNRTLVGGRILPLYRDAVNVFDSPSQLGLNTKGIILKKITFSYIVHFYQSQYFLNTPHKYM